MTAREPLPPRVRSFLVDVARCDDAPDYIRMEAKRLLIRHPAAADDDAGMTVTLKGPAVTEQTIREAGEAAAGLMNSVAEAVGLPPDLFAVGEAYISCDGDGCDARRAIEGDAVGWHRTDDGLDFCPRCADREERTPREYAPGFEPHSGRCPCGRSPDPGAKPQGGCWCVEEEGA